MADMWHWLTKEDSKARDILMYAITAILFAGGAYYVYARWTQDSRPQESAIACSNPDCDFTEMRELKIGEVFPLECPDCGQKKVFPGFSCPGCGTVNIWNESLGKKPPTLCKKCGRECYHGMP